MTKDLKEMQDLKSSGYSYKQIADKYNVPISTIKSRLNRAKNGLSLSKKISYCKNCGAKLTLIPNKKEKIFCSNKCRYKYWLKSKGSRICKYCGKEFILKSNATQIFCSKDCYFKYKKESLIKR